MQVAEPNRPRLAALAANDRVAAPPEYEALGPEQDHGQHQQRQRRGSRQLRLRRVLEQAPDLGRHRVKSGGQCQDRRRAEQRHGLQESNQRARDQCRQRQRDRNAPRGGPGATAEDGRSVLEIARDAIQGIRHQNEDVGEGVAGDDEDQARKRVDVEQPLVLPGPGHISISLIEQPAVRRGQQFPGDRAEERRCDERRHHQQAHELRYGRSVRETSQLMGAATAQQMTPRRGQA